MITKETVNHIAQLARLGLTSQERKKFQRELSLILEFVNQLNEVQTDRAKPLSQIAGLENVMRLDKAGPVNERVKKKLLKLAPASKDGYVKTPSVL